MKILIIEDDIEIVELIKQGLAAESYVIESASNGEKGYLMAFGGVYSLIIIDNFLPQKSGLEIIDALRRAKINTPILMMTVHSSIENKTAAFSAGADDYLTKPFLLEELIIRIKALLRRPVDLEKSFLKMGNLYFDSESNCFKRGHKELYLTKKEYCLLKYFFQHQGKVITRGEILENVWHYNSNPFSNSIETHIASLRKKINSTSNNQLIHTFHGRGYKLSLKKL